MRSNTTSPKRVGDGREVTDRSLFLKLSPFEANLTLIRGDSTDVSDLKSRRVKSWRRYSSRLDLRTC